MSDKTAQKRRKNAQWFKGGHKRSRNYGTHHKGADQNKGDRPLEAGCQGLIFTFAGLNPNPKFAIGEARRLLETYVDKLKPELVPSPSETKPLMSTETVTNTADNDNSSSTSESDNEDVSDSLRKELDQCQQQSTAGSGQRHFGLLTTACNVKNVIIIDTSHIVHLTDFVRNMVADLYGPSAAFRCRTLQRLVPFEMACKTTPSDLQNALEQLLPNKFKAHPSESPSYAVYFKSRYTDVVNRATAIELCADIVRAVSPLTRANLKQPDIAVLIEIIANRTCISVVSEYTQLKRYNLQPETEKDIGNKGDPK